MNPDAARAIDDEPCHCNTSNPHHTDQHRPPRDVPTPRVDYVELSDTDHAAITITTRRDSTWITCTSGPDEVTVGPVPTQDITNALPAKHTPPRSPAPTAPSTELLETALAAALADAQKCRRGRDEERARADEAESECGGWRVRADEAERERDQARADRDAAERERDEWRAEAESLTRQLHDAQQDADMTRTELEAEQPRPLTPDAITDEMVDRYWAAMRNPGTNYDDAVRRALAAALTEPPARPEGLTRLIDTIREATYDPEPVATGEALYNAGVRAPEDGES